MENSPYHSSGIADLVDDMQTLQAILAAGAYAKQRPAFKEVFLDMVKRAENTMKTPLGVAYLKKLL